MMRAKMLLFMFGAFLVISALISLDTFSASSTKVYIDPSKIASVTWTPGEQFNITAKVIDVVDLFAWQFQLSWNSTVLKFIDVTEGPVLAAQPEGTFYVEDTNQTKRLGSIAAFATTLGDYGGVSLVSPGTLAYITFEVKEFGETTFHLYDTLLLDSQFHGQPEPENYISHTTADGYFINVGVPEAVFTYSPSFPVVNETTTFDASGSYDTDGTIVAYAWDFGDGTKKTFIGANLTDTTTHTYTQVGSYAVNLTVQDDKGITNSLVSTFAVVFHHNVGVTGVSFDVSSLKSGDSLTITVTVRNAGADPETFDVTAYYGDVSIGTEPVSNLAPSATKELQFVWDTAGVASGDYDIKAVATLDGDEYLDNNSKSGGGIYVEAADQQFPFLYVGAGIAGVIVVVVLAWYFIGRRKG